MEWESDSSCHSHTYPGQECSSPGRHSSWELEFRDCGAIPGQGLLTAERWIEGMWGRRLWWEMLVEESQAAMEARRYYWPKGKNLQSRLLYLAKTSFKIDGEVKSFSDKQKLREFSTTKLALQQMLKGLVESRNTREEKRSTKSTPNN